MGNLFAIASQIQQGATAPRKEQMEYAATHPHQGPAGAGTGGGVADETKMTQAAEALAP